MDNHLKCVKFISEFFTIYTLTQKSHTGIKSRNYKVDILSFENSINFMLVPPNSKNLNGKNWRSHKKQQLAPFSISASQSFPISQVSSYSHPSKYKLTTMFHNYYQHCQTNARFFNSYVSKFQLSQLFINYNKGQPRMLSQSISYSMEGYIYYLLE